MRSALRLARPAFVPGGCHNQRGSHSQHDEAAELVPRPTPAVKSDNSQGNEATPREAHHDCDNQQSANRATQPPLFTRKSLETRERKAASSRVWIRDAARLELKLSQSDGLCVRSRHPVRRRGTSDSLNVFTPS
jgi:hypothetical protein